MALHPSGIDLCSGTLDGNGLPTPMGNAAWQTITVSNVSLSVGVDYAIVIKAPDGSTDNWAWIARDDTIGGTPYTRGDLWVTTDSGVAWSTVTDDDFLFEEYAGAVQHENYTTISGSLAYSAAYGTQWQGQGFNPQATHTITSIKLKMFRTGSPGTVTVSVQLMVDSPTLTTQAVSSIATTTATGNGNITDLGTPNPTAHGVCYNTTGSPTTSDGTTDEGAASSTGAFTTSMTGLTPGTLYYVKAYATNSEGTGYGGEVSFTSYKAPTVTTQAVSSIAGTTATGNGNITDLGSPNPTAHGVCYNTTGSPTTADDTTDEGAAAATGAFTSNMTGLSINTKYYVKAYATNAEGTSYGSEVNFTTLGVPTVTSQTCESVVGATATGRGNITVIGNPTPTAHGHCWNTSADPTTANSVVDNGAASVIGMFISSITGLTPGTGYYTRAYATNTQGTVYGANVYFVAPTTGVGGRSGYIWDESSNLRSFDANALERQYVHTDDVDDTPINGATTAPVSSNWAYDHVAAADPHTGYVLETLFDADTFLYASSDNTPVATSPVNVLAALSGHAGAAFAWNSQNLSGIGTLNTHTIPSGTDTFCLLAATQELDNKTLDSSVAKGTWTASGTWTIPAVTLGGTVTGGNNDLDNIGHIGSGNEVAQATVGIYFHEIFTGNVSQRIGTEISIAAHITSAAYSDVAELFSGYFGASISNTNTQNWTKTVGLRGVTGVVGLATGTAATKTITGAASFYADLSIGSATNDMVLTNYYGLYIDALPLIGNSKLTNDYGIYVADQAGGATLNYAIYTNAGLVRFGGAVTLASTLTDGTATLSSGAWTGATYSGLTISTTTGTFTLTSGKTLSVSNTLTLTATDSATLAIGGGGTLGSAAYTASTAYEVAGAVSTHAGLSDPHTGYVLESLFDAHSIIYSISDNTPAQLTVGEQTLVGRITSGNITALSITQVKTLVGAGAASGLATLDSDTRLVESAKVMADADNDTKIQVEESADEDKIRMDVAGVEAFLLDNVGILDLAKQSRARAYQSAVNQVVQDSFWLTLLLDAESYDGQNEFDSTVTAGTADATEALKLHDEDGGFSADDVGAGVWNTTDNTYSVVAAFVDSGELTLDNDIMANGEGYKVYRSRFTATNAGRYLITASICYLALLDQQDMGIAIAKNGTRIYSLFPSPSRAGNISVDIVGIEELATNDYIQIFTYQIAGATKEILKGSTVTLLAIHKLS